jgi:hypothetical protein
MLGVERVGLGERLYMDTVLLQSKLQTLYRQVMLVRQVIKKNGRRFTTQWE